MPKSRLRKRRRCNPVTLSEKKLARALRAGDNGPKSTKFTRNDSLELLRRWANARQVRTSTAQVDLNVGPRTSRGSAGTFWESVRMKGPRLERILASTALALVLAALTSASATAQDTGTPTAATASEAAAAAGAAAVATSETAPAPSSAPAPASEATAPPNTA